MESIQQTYVTPDGSVYKGDKKVGINDTVVPDRPTPWSVWANGEWLVDVPALIARLTTDINSWRDEQEQQLILFEYAGRTWDGGLRVADRLRPVTLLASLPAGFFWTDASNDDVELSYQEVVGLAAAHEAALVQHGWSIHARQRTMKQSLLALTAEELLLFKPSW